MSKGSETGKMIMRSMVPRRARNGNASSSDQSPSSEKQIPKRRVRRNASLRTKTLIKVSWLSKAKSERATGRANKSVSNSAVTGSCNTVVEVVGKRGTKRKVAAADGGPSSKRKRRLDTEDRENQGKTQQEEFEAKYQQLGKLNEGGCGSVFAGHRRADNLPVAIKHVPDRYIYCKHVDNDGKQISIEVAVMLKLAADSDGTSPHIRMLDWYKLDKELILVLERPMPAVDFYNYLRRKGGFLREEAAKVIISQLVDGAIDLKNKNIFHRDIKPENMLIETSSDVPRVRLIDFGLSSFDESDTSYKTFYGTLVTPEVFRKMRYRAGPTTVYQIGAVAFKALASENCFNRVRLLKRNQQIPKFISKTCKNFIQTCLSVDPDDRPTVEQLRVHPWLK
uniref:Serine/threonine-protein kinase n=1 Tax=Gasterosteus aculeatus aculeatus TaxID=481459 RepID=G3NWT2_GASAC